MAEARSPVTLTIDGKSVTVEKGTYVIDAARRAGIYIPYFCSHIKLAPDANCRMCLVEVEKMPKLQTACNLPVTEGMVVRSTSEKAEQAHKGVMEFILANHPLDCPLCDQGGECELQDRSHAYSDNVSHYTEPKRLPEKRYFSPYIEREMSRCITCMRCVRYCDEVLDVRAIAAVNRGDRIEISTFMDRELDCEFCGGCVQICPVGAFTNRVALYDYRPWQLKKTDTVCAYCADGCMLTLESKVRENEIVRVTSDWDKGRNLGDLCAKGFFGYHMINSSDRLTAPMIRESGALVEWPWIEALESAAQRLLAIKRQYGAGAIGGVISARCTNEEAYLFQKLLRLAIGTPHIDSSARDGHVNSVRALTRVTGHGRMTASYEEIEAARTILVIGADPTETNPITALRVKAAVRKHGATLITVGPYLKEIGPVSNLVNLSAAPLPVTPGSESMAVRALVKAVIEGGLVDPSVSAQAPAYVGRLEAAVGGLPWPVVEARTGASAEAIKSAARRLAGAERAVVLFGPELTRQAGGYDAVCALADLAILTGLYAKAGSGLNPLCEETNETGVVEMGASPEFLPGLVDVRDESARRRLRDAWNEELPSADGWNLIQMLEQARQGRLKALYLVGEDPLGSLPASSGVGEALQSLDLLICQDLFLTETGRMAHLVLPAAGFAEKEGSFTNHEGRAQQIRRAIEPIGESMPDWEIFSQLAAQIGYPLDYASAAEIAEEARRLTPALESGARSDGRPGGRINGQAMARYLSDVSGAELDARYHPADHVAARRAPDQTGTAEQGGDGEGNSEGQNGMALRLLLNQSLFHSGKLSRRASELDRIEPAGRLQLNPSDAKRLGVEDGDLIRVRPRGGAPSDGVIVPVVCRAKLTPGFCRFPGHFPEAGVKELVDWSVDPVTQAPYFRSGRVWVEKTAGAATAPPAEAIARRGV
ncbi:MAG TPA: NADH-quinone oxidoreductase subunit NuoG [Nitrospiria bacterium]|nr:NADH-quinone oxidoreductase subunit NuoG [Nitrospiria bacterium]